MTPPHPGDQPSFGQPDGQPHRRTDWHPDRRQPRAGLDDLLDDDALHRFVADTRVEHAVSDRARERWLRQLSEDELDLMSVLANLAVRAETVRLVTAGGQHRGVIRSIGADHVCLVTSADVLVVVPMWSASAVFASGVRPAGRIVVPTGPRLNEALSSLATDRPWVQVRVNGHQQLIGGVLELSTAEVVVLSTDVERRGRGGPGRETAYVALSSIAELLLSVSG